MMDRYDLEDEGIGYYQTPKMVKCNGRGYWVKHSSAMKLKTEIAKLKAKLHDQEEYDKAYAEEWKAELPNIRADAIEEMVDCLHEYEGRLMVDDILAHANKLKDK
ncbi:MAG: hypothetical protein GY928_18795 [Colwellia sp.]|nr:hypothetical protein [Colwellia sp.]